MTKRESMIRTVEAETHLFSDDGTIPNNPTLPLLIYPQVLRIKESEPASICETVFHSNQWGRSWRNGIFSYHHFHSTAHEVLAIACGWARVHFGGERGTIVTVKAGDVAVIPAGVGHKNLGASPDLLVIGAYPPGPDWDLCREQAGERPQVLENILQVPLPMTDPVYGSPGPLRPFQKNKYTYSVDFWNGCWLFRPKRVYLISGKSLIVLAQEIQANLVLVDERKAKTVSRGLASMWSEQRVYSYC